jgi:hypothetical protein
VPYLKPFSGRVIPKTKHHPSCDAAKEFPMRRYLLSAVISVATAGVAMAGGSAHNSHDRDSHRSHDSYRSRDSFKDYRFTHGTKFEHGYFYKGKEHSHWSSRCYSERYGCDIYYCPSVCCWYYFCTPDCCYYPVSFCPYGKFGF